MYCNSIDVLYNTISDISLWEGNTMFILNKLFPKYIYKPRLPGVAQDKLGVGYSFED